MTLVISILIYLPKLVLGFAIAHALWKEADLPAILLKAGVAIPLGLACSATTFYIAILLGIPPSIYSWVELGCELLLIFILGLQAWQRRNSILKINTGFQKFPVGILIISSGFILFISAFVYYARLHTYGFEDAWSIWNLVPRSIYRANSPAILLEPRFYERFHADYPIDLNLNVAWGWFISRNEETRIPMALALLIASVSMLIFWAGMWKWRSHFNGALGALFLSTSLSLATVVGQYSDELLAVHMLATLITLYGYIKSKEPNLLILAGLLAGFSAWVKNEGLLFVGVFVLVCILASWRNVLDWRHLKQLGMGLIVPLGVVIVYKFQVGAANDLFNGHNSFMHQILDLSRWLYITKSFLTAFLQYGNWPVSLLIVLALYAILMGIDHIESRNTIWLILILFGQLIGYFGIYLITPVDLKLHIDTSLERLILHIYPLVVFSVLTMIREPQAEFQKTPS